MSEEIELKLALLPEDLERLPRKALLRNLKAGMARKRHLRSTYFDTPSLTLRQHGMALRVRDTGEGRVQTLKAPLNGAGQGAAASEGLQHLREFEAPLDGETPNLELIDAPDLQAFFASEGVASDLEPVFTTEFDRQAIPLLLADSRIELALDSGHIRSGRQEMALSEAELELQSGAPGRLYELAMLLHRHVPFHLERQSKALRGYNLYAESPATPHKASKASPDATMTVAEAFEYLARNCVAQMRANEDPALDGRDPEGVHQLRVAIRRLRALVKAFAPAFAPEPLQYLKTELSWLQKELGPARDWDVFLGETLPPLQHRLPAAENLSELAEVGETLRGEGYERARAAIRSPRYTDLLLHLSLWVSQGGWRPNGNGEGVPDAGAGPVVPFAQEILDQRHKKFCKLARRYGTLSEGELHRLRIRGKQARYAAEFFANLFPNKAAKRYRKRLEAIQDCLGAFNDAATGQRLVDALEQRAAARDGNNAVASANATGIVIGWQAAHMERGLDAFASAWKAFKDTKPFWRKG